MSITVGSVALVAGCPRPRDSQKALTHLDLARDLLGKGQDNASETEIKKAIAVDPENEESFLLYGLVYLVRAAQTENLVERENCLQGVEAETLQHQADELTRKAGEKFARATDLAPEYGEAWLNRAVVAMHFGDWEQAVGHASKALAQPARLQSTALARANLGWALHHAHESARATTELLQALQETPNLCVARWRLARVLFDRERFDDAEQQVSWFSPVSEEGMAPAPCSAPPLLEALYLGGQVKVRSRDAAAAMPWFQKCVEVAPHSCVAQQCERALTELGAEP